MASLVVGADFSVDVANNAGTLAVILAIAPATRASMSTSSSEDSDSAPDVTPASSILVSSELTVSSTSLMVVSGADGAGVFCCVVSSSSAVLVLLRRRDVLLEGVSAVCVASAAADPRRDRLVSTMVFQKPVGSYAATGTCLPFSLPPEFSAWRL